MNKGLCEGPGWKLLISWNTIRSVRRDLLLPGPSSFSSIQYCFLLQNKPPWQREIGKDPCESLRALADWFDPTDWTERKPVHLIWQKKTKKNSANTSLSKPKRATTNNKTIIETRLFKDCKIVLFIHTDHLTYKQKDGEFLCRNSTTLNHPWKQYLIWLVNLNIEYKEKNYPQNSIPNMKRVPDFLAATFTL